MMVRLFQMDTNMDLKIDISSEIFFLWIGTKTQKLIPDITGGRTHPKTSI